MAEKLTVIIPCKNEEANICGCIHSARKVADEIVIADSGSTDRTLQIVENAGGLRVIRREYVNSGDFKNWAIPQATHRWVLILDADERIPDPLAREILQRLERPAQTDGYWVYRSSYFMGHRVRFSGWQNDRVLRLFRRDRGRYHGDNDHAEVVISSGRVGRLRNRMLHYSYWTYADYLQRMQRYATYQASKWQEQDRAVSLPKLVLNLPLRFLQLYILRLGFLDGLVGFQVSLLTAIYSFSKQACLWQLRHGRTPDEVNRDVADLIVSPDAQERHHRPPGSCAGSAISTIPDAGYHAADRLGTSAPMPVRILRSLSTQQVCGAGSDDSPSRVFQQSTFHSREDQVAQRIPNPGTRRAEGTDTGHA